jgi:xylan 1,4-beta-xylosidase
MFGLIILSLSLLVILTNMPKIQTLLSQAGGKPANLIIDTQGIVGPLNTPWRNLAQGGESPDYRFAPVINQLQALRPKYIRFDHLFDFYAGVQKNSAGQIVVDWQKADALLSDIQVAGAAPLVVLSYLPPGLSADGDVTSVPANWDDWSDLIRQTIEHISGTNGLNLTNVYYEVWNEPDLFGQWKAGGTKNYFMLYEKTVRGAGKARNTRPFFIGGPATTSLYPNWLTKFMDYVNDRKLRLDFYSWHIYDLNPETYAAQIQQFDTLMRRYPAYIFRVEPVISEWGPASNIDPIYDSNTAAAHLVAVNALLPPTLKKAFIFEFQDGESSSGQTYWGRWGLLTSPSSGSLSKPRYQALELLNRLGDLELSVVGQGSWVKAIAGKDPNGAVKMVIANYDSEDRHTETVPLTFERLTPGTYILSTQFLGRSPQKQTFTVTGTSYQHSLALPPNAVVFLELATQ